MKYCVVNNSFMHSNEILTEKLIISQIENSIDQFLSIVRIVNKHLLFTKTYRFRYFKIILV